MSLMSINRIKYLREELEAEDIDTEGLCEIQEAFDKIPQSELPEPRENAMAGDQLNELEARVTPLEFSIYDYIVENFGENEANEPSWDIGDLANHIEQNFKFIDTGSDSNEVAFVWSVEDVMGIEPESGDLKDALTEDEARQVLHNFERHHDGSYEAMWQDLEYHVQDFKDNSEDFDDNGSRKG